MVVKTFQTHEFSHIISIIISLFTVCLLACVHSPSAKRVASGLGGCFGFRAFLNLPYTTSTIRCTEIEINTANLCEREKESSKGKQITAGSTNLLNADQRPVQVIFITEGNINWANRYDRQSEAILFLSWLKTHRVNIWESILMKTLYTCTIK